MCNSVNLISMKFVKIDKLNDNVVILFSIDSQS